MNANCSNKPVIRILTIDEFLELIQSEEGQKVQRQMIQEKECVQPFSLPSELIPIKIEKFVLLDDVEEYFKQDEKEN
jgi:hypothetical protein